MTAFLGPRIALRVCRGPRTELLPAGSRCHQQYKHVHAALELCSCICTMCKQHQYIQRPGKLAIDSLRAARHAITGPEGQYSFIVATYAH
jgi:hypothetical protein